ncbi:uncharacterized protein LOC113511842 [Galleria mellonella]|uniref:Uncharacterized protein LOC113511842 n=1 Tax=Galleria mellonella TaxID=7137 RepID=A0A6J1WD08_GALME|nr:uncharacterized protein LOC113511842 [Galleria mellonella]
MQVVNFIATFVLFTVIKCSPFDDGKYDPKKYGNDDGKYYRPLNEGKYIPGDEGKYTYVYKQGLYPDYPYVHEVGPNGGVGGFGGNGGYGGNGPNGPGDPRDNNISDRPGKIEYIGRKIYAERYPYLHKVIKALIDRYVSFDNLFGETPEGSINHYFKTFADKKTAIKCKYLNTKGDSEGYTSEHNPQMLSRNGKNIGNFYSFRGTKILNNVTQFTNSSNKNNLKIEYEVYIRIADEPIQFTVLVFGVVTSNALDDGRYRPGSYGGDDGRYRPSNEGRYAESYDNRYDYSSGSNSNNRYQRPQSSFSQNAGIYRPLGAASAASPTYYQQQSSYVRPQQTSYVRPQQRNEQNARILRQDNEIDVNSYRYSYQTENGINAEEAGRLENTATGPGIRATGFFEYLGDDGVTYRVDYTADEFGFHPSGAHLPQIPRV